MLTLPNYQIVNQIYESANSIVYRSIRNTDNQPVILKMLKQDYPTSAELTRYWQEYEITQGLDLAGVIKVYGIEKYQNTLVIIVEDFGGESLKQLTADRPLTVKEFLPFAIKIADSLGNIHAANIIHKDINPSNIVWEPVTKQIKIIDFGIASRLPRENPSLTNPEQLEGTLAYLSPEQSGRINRSIDYRTDLYSLGVTFYELLTGVVPFEATDAMELVHCHIAKTPLAVSVVNPKVPPILSELIMKLMAKNAEDRYQSAFGLKADLEKLQRFQNIDDLNFPLAQNDFSGHFQIPQKLYGRENELSTLLQAFERVSLGNAEMMLIAGYSGVGKSALVHEVHKPMTEKRGYFAAGKFEQLGRNIPYLALNQAFNNWFEYLLTESHEQLQQWKKKILTAIGENGQVLLDVFPHLASIIGPQPTVAEVGASEAQNRFHLVLQSFIKAISQKEHPFILFLDDLQWADSASLNLLTTLMADKDHQHFLLIGAYRENEVDAAHPLSMAVKSLHNAGTTINLVQLANLSKSDVNTLLADALTCSSAQVQTLNELIYAKTHGNAFFTHEFLKSLYEEQLLTFDFNQFCWQWDVATIAQKEITDNVVALMAEKIQKLPIASKNLLTLAAGIGNQFDVVTLALISQQSPPDTFLLLQPAMTEGLLLPLGHYNVHQITSQTDVQVKFAHDRIQQAAYSLILEPDRPNFHQQIGHYLWQAFRDNLDDKIFAIVDHLNLGTLNPTQRGELARLNLQAAQKATAATAYQLAYDYSQKGINLLNQATWQEEYLLTLQLYNLAAEAAYLNGDFEQMATFSQAIMQQATTVLDKVKISEINIQALTIQRDFSAALNHTQTILSLLGIKLPHRPQVWHILIALVKTQLILRGKSIAGLATLPQMTQPEKLAAMAILNTSASAAYQSGSNLFPITVFERVILSIKYGNSAESIFGYCNYGVVLCGITGDIERGYQFGQLSLQLLSQFHAKSFETKTHFVFNATIRHWKEHGKKTIPSLLEAYQTGLETGDLEYAAHAALLHLYHLFFLGKEVSQLIADILLYKNRIKKLNQPGTVSHSNILHQTLLNLTTASVTPKYILDGEAYQEAEMLSIHQQTHDSQAIYFLHLYKMILSYLFGDYDEAFKMTTLAFEHIESVMATVMMLQFYFYDSLICLALYPATTKLRQITLRFRVKRNQQKLKKWAKHAPMNVQHKYDLVEAEKARVFGQLIKAELFYDQAITGAKANDYLHEEALAYELAAEFYLKRGMTICAQSYRREAHYAYQQWGALAKVEDLEAKYPQLSKTPKNFNSTVTAISTITNLSTTRFQTSTVLDVDSVTKASQTLAGEIILSKLLEKMMHLVIENAGAERGFLILPHDEKWVIEAEGAIDKEEVTVLYCLPIENQLPTAIINYVAHTQENVVLANASAEGLYTENEYIKAHQTQSVLCFPIVYQQQLRAILYLENNLMTGAFTPQRLNVLKMLSSQIAISLENAEYANHLEEKVKQRTSELAQANQEIMALNERLEEENLRMSAELDVAKQLQQMVLPKETELEQIESLDIAGFMAPADEVGGDYYEILNHDGRIKIGIGDVTGHGLESGVLMLMVQTTVRALLLAGIDNPEQFLNIINQTIYHNAQRMGTDKNLTLSLLDYQNGCLQLTGQHEDVLLVRQNGQVERIDTFDLGFMIGVKRDILKFASHLEISLQPGDGLVLYTDGITEAQNLEEALYGIDRLCEVVSRHWSLTAQEIQQAVVADVKQYIGTQKVFDDITLLVLKQK